jgi:hypothetical protein
VADDRWYTALLVAQSAIRSEMTSESLTEIQYRLIQAADPEEA